MIPVVLGGVLLLTAGGCVRVVLAARGGPRWTRVVAAATLTAGEPARRPGRRRNDTGGADD
ncbi:hypothetical protein AB0M23_23455 [Streptomyces sp. NPDC052077]|uniref:hypothetical protein n=1 Tax=Streptomyces sp. NPDC052077 TaxID=3154757 RepID=UPI0034318DD0